MALEQRAQRFCACHRLWCDQGRQRRERQLRLSDRQPVLLDGSLAPNRAAAVGNRSGSPPASTSRILSASRSCTGWGSSCAAASTIDGFPIASARSNLVTAEPWLVIPEHMSLLDLSAHVRLHG